MKQYSDAVNEKYVSKNHTRSVQIWLKLLYIPIFQQHYLTILKYSLYDCHRDLKTASIQGRVQSKVTGSIQRLSLEGNQNGQWARCCFAVVFAGEAPAVVLGPFHSLPLCPPSAKPSTPATLGTDTPWPSPHRHRTSMSLLKRPLPRHRALRRSRPPPTPLLPRCRPTLSSASGRTVESVAHQPSSFM